MKLENELELLMTSNGDLAERISNFKNRHVDPCEHSMLGEMALSKLLILTDQQIEIGKDPDIYDFVTSQERLLEIVKSFGAGNIFDGIIAYSEKLRRVPGAVCQQHLSGWARQLLLMAGLTLVSHRQK